MELDIPWSTARNWIRKRGGVPPRWAEPSGRYLSLVERETIAVRLAAGSSIRGIARELGRSPSTVSREVRRNTSTKWGSEYRGLLAHARALDRARRPKTRRLATDPRLASWVQDRLEDRWSPRQIAKDLPMEFPDDPTMRISHEAIYQSLFVQGRGGLRKELTTCLRSGRVLRRPRRQPGARTNQPRNGMLMISERPAEALDRAVPGHWEGDLILGRGNLSAIGTLVERSTRFVMLLHLPDDHHAETVRDAIVTQIGTLPATLRRTLTWDRGSELAKHADITTAAGIAVYFCDPSSPWQRGSNENTNGLLRQYFPKGTDLSVHSAEHLAFVADQLNGRPRETLGWRKPREALNDLLLASNT
jgi:transposase, IS30 family